MAAIKHAKRPHFLLAGAVFLILCSLVILAPSCTQSSHSAGHILVGLGALLGGFAIYWDIQRNAPRKIIFSLSTGLILYIAGYYAYSLIALGRCGL